MNPHPFRALRTLAYIVTLVVGVPARADWVAPPVAKPTVPTNTFTITDYGAVPDGKTLDTTSIQQAIAACAKAGGGTVVVPAGRFLTGPFSLVSNLNLRIEKGATLLISNDRSDYKMTGKGFENCIVAVDCHDVAITGSGTIDGQGEPWWKGFLETKNAPEGTPTFPHRPYMVVLRGCSRVLVEGVTLANSPSFHLVPQQCQDVTIDGVHFVAPAKSPNTDALDPSGWNFHVVNCAFDVGDDCIAVKATARIDPARPSCENFLVEHCTFNHGHGMSIGGQTPGGLRHMLVRDCAFDGTDAGIRMKAGRGYGGLVEDVAYENLTMKNVKVSIFITSYYPRIPENPAQDPAQPVNDKTPVWRNIRIDHVKSVGGATAGRILGLPEMPVQDVVLTDVSIAADKPMQVVHAKGMRFVNSQVSAKSGPPLSVEESDVQGIDPSTGR